MPMMDIDPAQSPFRIGALLVEGFAMMSYAAFMEPFRAANRLAGGALYAWTHISADGAAVRASNGLALAPDAAMDDATGIDLLMVFAAGNPAAFGDERCLGWLRGMARQGVAIGGVSGGPYLLARAGLLGGFRATIHWEHATAFREDFPDMALDPGLFVIDGARITCAGGTAGLDLALTLIEQRHGASLARAVSEWFIGASAREPEQAQKPRLADRYGTHNSRLSSMLGTMERAIEAPLDLAAIARRAGTSARHLDRLCRRELGQSIGEVYMGIRLGHAAQLLRSTGLGVTEVAMACGFRTASHFSRRFSAHFGFPPSQRGGHSAEAGTGLLPPGRAG